MTGVTLQLTAWQRDELARYADGEPHKFDRPPSVNLVRRGLVTLGQWGTGRYRITQLGHAALEAAAESENDADILLVTERDMADTGERLTLDELAATVASALPVLEGPDPYPRDPENRYRLYVRVGDRLEVIATAPDAGGLGCAIVTIHDDQRTVGRRLADLGRVGVLDAVAGEWIVLPWDRGEQPLTFKEGTQ